MADNGSNDTNDANDGNGHKDDRSGVDNNTTAIGTASPERDWFSSGLTIASERDLYEEKEVTGGDMQHRDTYIRLAVRTKAWRDAFRAVSTRYSAHRDHPAFKATFSSMDAVLVTLDDLFLRYVDVASIAVAGTPIQRSGRDIAFDVAVHNGFFWDGFYSRNSMPKFLAAAFRFAIEQGGHNGALNERSSEMLQSYGTLARRLEGMVLGFAQILDV
ncbi:hypothetical protein SPI_03471 [Niveomyces insectorum RCEF 264]|uniref:Uncharacterized protein n=1 Tax=Niveomyces insectorum RCEF 264 TaxID=1081102 RepID=A0A167W3W8_9HYPO|nr:hypothetical protein SPI_03471 [Niveomyces insectorum RCEF 264]